MSEVVGMRGSMIPEGQINQDVVDALETLLAKAKRGEIAAFIAGWVNPQNWIGSVNVYSYGYRWSVSAAADLAKGEFIKTLLEET